MLAHSIINGLANQVFACKAGKGVLVGLGPGVTVFVGSGVTVTGFAVEVGRMRVGDLVGSGMAALLIPAESLQADMSITTSRKKTMRIDMMTARLRIEIKSLFPFN